MSKLYLIAVLGVNLLSGILAANGIFHTTVEMPMFLALGEMLAQSLGWLPAETWLQVFCFAVAFLLQALITSTWSTVFRHGWRNVPALMIALMASTVSWLTGAAFLVLSSHEVTLRDAAKSQALAPAVAALQGFGQSAATLSGKMGGLADTAQKLAAQELGAGGTCLGNAGEAGTGTLSDFRAAQAASLAQGASLAAALSKQATEALVTLQRASEASYAASYGAAVNLSQSPDLARIGAILDQAITELDQGFMAKGKLQTCATPSLLADMRQVRPLVSIQPLSATLPQVAKVGVTSAFDEIWTAIGGLFAPSQEARATGVLLDLGGAGLPELLAILSILMREKELKRTGRIPDPRDAIWSAKPLGTPAEQAARQRIYQRLLRQTYTDGDQSFFVVSKPEEAGDVEVIHYFGLNIDDPFYRDIELPEIDFGWCVARPELKGDRFDMFPMKGLDGWMARSAREAMKLSKAP